MGTYTRELVRGLERAGGGHRFTVIAPQPPVEDVGHEWRTVPLRLPPVTAAAPRMVWEQVSVPRVLRRLRPDVVHWLHSGSSLRAQAPTVMTVYDAIPWL